MSIVSLLLLAGAAHAQEHRSFDFDFEEPPDGFGIGIVLGDPSGLTVAFRKGEHSAVQVDFGYGVDQDRFHISADYLYNVVILETPEMAGIRFPLYIGVGGRYLSYASDPYYDRDPGLAVRVPI